MLAGQARRPAKTHANNCPPAHSTSRQVYDHDASGSHDLIGRAEASLAQLQAAATQGQPLPLVNPRKQGRPGYTSSGAVGWSRAAGCWSLKRGLVGLQRERSHMHVSATTVLCTCRRGAGGEERDCHTPPLFPGLHSR